MQRSPTPPPRRLLSSFRRCDVLISCAITHRKRVCPQPVDFLTRLSSTPTAPSSAPTPVQEASISPTTAPGAIIPAGLAANTRSRCTWSSQRQPSLTELAASFIDRPSSSAARPASARFWCGDTTSPRPSISPLDDAGDLRFLLVSMPGPIWWPWPSNCRTRRTASWSGRYLRSRLCRGSDPHGTKHESSRSGLRDHSHAQEMVAEFDYQPVAATGLSPDRLAKTAIEKRGGGSVRSTATSSSSPMTARCRRSACYGGPAPGEP